MAKRLRKGLIAFLLVAVMACAAGFAVMFSRPSVAQADTWTGDLAAAGWNNDKSDSDISGYDIKWVDKGDIVENGLKNGVEGADEYSEGKIAYIEISKANALAYFSYAVHADTDHKLDGAYVKLTENIDLDNNIWIPIGQTNRKYPDPAIRFSGTFDGGNHTISNLKLTTADLEEKLIYESGSYYIQQGSTKVPFGVDDTEYTYGLFGVVKSIKIKNLTVDNVNISFEPVTPAGGSELVPDNVGAIVGFGTRSVYLDNCIVGSESSDNKIAVLCNQGGAYGGLIGRMYPNTNGSSNDSTDGGVPNIVISNCKNYADIEYVGTKDAKVGGIFGYAAYTYGLEAINCVNYGDVCGGNYVGGITSYFNTAKDSADKNHEGSSYSYKYINCDNYGNIVSEKAVRCVAGIASIDSWQTVDIEVSGCDNYGNIGGIGYDNSGSDANASGVGGILGYFRGGSSTSKIVNNYNYGDVYGYGDNGNVGGYIGRIAGTDGITVSGGNFGTVYGNDENNKGSLAGLVRNGNKNVDIKTIGTFLIDEGEVIDYSDEMSKDDFKQPKADLTNAHYHPNLSEITSDAYFKYIDSGKTIIGLADNADVSNGIKIPAGVEKIAYTAFAGNSKITKVTFEEGSALKEIEDLAFIDSSITSLELPAGLEKIGLLAFAYCEDLNYVQLSAGAENTELGDKVFVGTRKVDLKVEGAFIIATDSAQYKDLISVANYADCGGELTFVVTIKYYRDGVSLKESGSDDTKDYVEYRLRGQEYKVVQNSNGYWGVLQNDPSVGGNVGGSYVWYYGTETRPYAQASDMTYLLAGITVDEIVLNSYSDNSSGKVFIARDNLVYSAGMSYDKGNVNSLLIDLSDRITNEMKVTLGNGEDEDWKIENAGTYVLKIKDGNTTYELEVVIGRATVTLANLDWVITEIGKDTGLSTNLMSYGTLYIYTYKNGSGEYPSPVLLGDEEIKAHGLNSSFVTRAVDYSAVRNRNKDITIELANVDSVVYQSVNYENNAVKGVDDYVGAYSAVATITANSNYKFAVGQLNSLLGLSIEISGENSDTATVTKNWYIVDFSNWLIVQGTNTEYTLNADHVYGEAFGNIPVPQPAHTETGVQISFILELVDEDGTHTFSWTGTNLLSQYIHQYMPAGRYTLTINVPSVISKEFENGVEGDIFHNAFSETFTFTVDKAQLPSLDAIKNALSGPYVVDVEEIDGEAPYNATAKKLIDDYLNPTSLPSRGTVWGDSSNSGYFSSKFTMEFNLLRWYDDVYRSSVNLLTPDTYTIYYKISAKNYYSNIDNDSRYNYSYEVISCSKVSAPILKAGDLTYTGYEVRPEITENSLYYAIWNDANGYVTGGTHYVSFELYDKEHYYWDSADADLDFDAITGNAMVKFEIKAASNKFTVALNMLGWEYESFAEDVNNIHAAALYLDSGADIHFSIKKEGADAPVNAALTNFTLAKDKNGELTVVGSNVLAALKALSSGKYVLSATVNATANYEGLTASVTFEISKARNAWLLNEENELNIPNWIVGRYDAENEDHAIIIKAQHGVVNFRIEDMGIEGKEYYNSTNSEMDLVEALNQMEVGQYLLVAWVDGTNDYDGLAAYTFKFQIFEKPGLPWWAVLLIVIGSLGLAALVIFILWKKGVFQIVTDKILLAIRTRVSVEATIASVRAAKRMEEGRKSVAEAKRKERLEQAREKQRSMTPEERAAQLEAKAQANAERAEKLRAKSEADLAKVEKMRKENAASDVQTEEQSEVASTDSETPSEE